MLDLGAQLRDYLDATAPVVELDDIVAVSNSDPPVRLSNPRRPSRPLPGWVAATAAAIAVLLLVGGVAWLVRADQPDGPTVSTTVAPTTVATTTVAPTTVASPPPPTPPDTLIPQLVAEVVTPSSIGDASWTVYEGASAESLESFAEAEFGSSEDAPPTLPDPLLSTEGIVTGAGSSVVGRAGGTTLTQWFVGIDWKATVLLHGGDELPEQSDNGELLLLTETSSAAESGSVEAYLFANHEELRVYQEAYCCGVEPPEGDQPSDVVVAAYEWTHSQEDSGWVFEVVDSSSGEPVGSVSTPFPLYGPYPIFAVSRGETTELVSPIWFESDFEWFSLDNEDAMLVYVKAGDSNSALPFEIWRSADGMSWENLGPAPGFPVGYFPTSVSGSAGLYVAYLDDITEQNEPGPDFLAIRSENGIDWVPVEVLPTTDGWVHRVDAGWVLTSAPGESSSLSIWVSPDAVDWEAVDTSGLPPTFFGFDGGGGGWTSAGNRLFVSNHRDDPPLARLWVVEFPSG